MTVPLADPVLVFTILISVILITPLLAERFRIPDMVLLLLAGTILGPHVTGLLARDSAITLFGSVGLLYIMFLAGLEIDLHRFASTRNRSIAFGLLTFAIPQGVGTFLCRFLLSMDWPQSVLLASMFASHTLLAYPIASRLGIAKTEPVIITIGATVITDTLALLVLAIIADKAKGAELDVWFWVSMILGMAALIFASLWSIPRLSRSFFRHTSENGGAQFLFVLGMMSAFAYLSTFVKMEPIIGAFIAGVSFNRLITRQSTLMNRIDFVGKTMFIPFFLISVGMLVNPGAFLASTHGWLVIIMMVLTVTLTKFAAAHTARFIFKYSTADGNVMFGLSVVQAAATLAAVLVGYQLGIFGDAVLNGAIIMIMVTCPLGSWYVEHYGKKTASEKVKQSSGKSTEQRFLIPVANPSFATRMLDLAFAFRKISAPGGIHTITVVPPEGPGVDNAVAQGEKLLGHCLAHASAADIQIIPSVHIDMNVSDGIIRSAKEVRADTVMIGWGGDRTVGARIFGTVLEKLLEECPPRLFLCRLMRPINTTRNLLVPFPPGYRRRSDINLLMKQTKILAKQIGAGLQYYSSDPNSISELRKTIDSARPSIPSSVRECENIQELQSSLCIDIGVDDTILIPTERPSEILWSQAFDKLPEILAARFPENNIIAVYPSLIAPESTEETTTRFLPDILSADMEFPGEPNEALYGMISMMKNMSEEQRRILVSQLSLERTFPVEIAPGVVLLHTRSDAVERTTLIIGFGIKESKFPGIEPPSGIILTLITPRRHTPEFHLAELSALARCFRESSLAQKIHKVRSSEDIKLILKDRLSLSYK